jgi:N-formylglutamate amidohydrolase
MSDFESGSENVRMRSVGGAVSGEEPVYEIVDPPALRSPLVFSSPHSGRRYAETFVASSRLDVATLRRSEDAYVEELFAAARIVGAPLLHAHVPRAFIDLNREPFELDPKLFDAPLPHYANTRSLRVAAGLGTVPRVVADAREIYPGRLPVAEALRRIELVYRPYHAALGGLMERARSRFGVAVLVDCHSMPSVSAREPVSGGRDRRRLDFVIGDRYGASAAREIVDGVETRLRNRGYLVQRNRPYAGGFITEHFGRPAAGWHALQIEISRSLYMDETSLTKKPEFNVIAGHISEIVAGLAHDIEAAEIFSETRRDAAE